MQDIKDQTVADMSSFGEQLVATLMSGYFSRIEGKIHDYDQLVSEWVKYLKSRELSFLTPPAQRKKTIVNPDGVNCVTPLKSGNRKGENCGKPAVNGSDMCTRHKGLSEKSHSPNEHKRENEHKRDNDTLCQVPIKSRKNDPCGKQAKNNGMCTRHFNLSNTNENTNEKTVVKKKSNKKMKRTITPTPVSENIWRIDIDSKMFDINGPDIPFLMNQHTKIFALAGPNNEALPVPFIYKNKLKSGLVFDDSTIFEIETHDSSDDRETEETHDSIDDSSDDRETEETHGISDEKKTHGISDENETHGISDTNETHGISDTNETHGISDTNESKKKINKPKKKLVLPVSDTTINNLLRNNTNFVKESSTINLSDDSDDNSDEDRL
jgi:hypothetical protein